VGSVKSTINLLAELQVYLSVKKKYAKGHQTLDWHLSQARSYQIGMGQLVNLNWVKKDPNSIINLVVFFDFIN